MSGSDSNASDDIEAAAEKALSLLIPDKSRGKYRRAYDNFKTWCDEKKVANVDERVLVAYFSTALKDIKSSYAWSIYSMLKCTLNLNDNVQISGFSNLTALLKRKSDGYNAKKSRILKKGDVYRFIKEAPDDQFLAVKVALIIGIYGGCRRDEISKMSVHDIKYIDRGIKITVPQNKIVRQFVVGEGDDSDVNLVKVVKKYAKLRPHDVPISRFFLLYKKGRCYKQPIGINTIATYPQKIATFLGLPFSNEYTGHCFRRSSISLLTQARVDLSILRCQSDNIAEGYEENSLNKKREIADHILGHKIVKIGGESSPTISAHFTVTATDSLASGTSPRSSNMAFNNTHPLPIKIEEGEQDETDYFHNSTAENETIIGTPVNEYSKNRINLSDEMSDTEIKEEPADDVDNSVYDEYTCEYLDEDSETETTQENESRKERAKTTRAQFQKLIGFMRCHSDFNNGKRMEAAETQRIDDAWNILIADLNAIGPPFRTSAQWRREWTNFKSNKRRRRTAYEANLEPSAEAKRMRIETSTLSDHYDVVSPMDDADDEDIPNSETNGEESHFHSHILKKMDLVIEQQKEQTDQLQKLNTNLQKLIEVITEKFP